MFAGNMLIFLYVGVVEIIYQHVGLSCWASKASESLKALKILTIDRLNNNF